MGTREIVVAVIDSGVDYNHPDLAANMWVNEGEIPGNETDDDGNRFIDDVYGYNLIGSTPNDVSSGIPDPCEDLSGDPMDDGGHGTHCAGIIGAATNNGIGVAGVCPNVRIMALKFLAANGYGSSVHAISCIQYAVNNGANIMSNSWGGGSYSPSLKAAIEAAGGAGLLFVAAAGNSAVDTDEVLHYPSCYDCNNIIAVLATDHNDALSGFSNYGANSVDIGAPGSSIMSTYYYSRYQGFNGTSMACPHVAGACALVWSINPSMDWIEVKDIVMASVDKLDSLEGKCVSEGRLNLHRAILNIPKAEGFVTLDRGHYNDAATITITVGDSNLVGEGTVDVNITTSAGGDLETVILTETPADSGLFIGSIATSPNSVSVDSNYLEVSDDEAITVVYEDDDDGTGSPGEVNDTAIADRNTPTISDVNVADISSVGAMISLQTDEPAYVQVSCATDVNGPFDIIGGGAVMEEHLVVVRGLSPQTTYYFKVEAFDFAGNCTSDTNDANYYNYTTAPSIVVPDDYSVIQDAIDAAWPFETIVVEPNTYYQTPRFYGKPLTLTGTDPSDWDVVESTIIDANGAREAIVFDSFDELTAPAVRGITIRNATYGAGPHLLGGNDYLAGPVLSNCVVEKCSMYGVRLTLRASGGDIRNNRIRNNYTGVSLGGGSAIVKGNWIYGNTRGIRTTGFYWANPNREIINNTIVNNSVGILHEVFIATPDISNCIIWSNDDDLDLTKGGATYSCIGEDFDANDPNYVGSISSDPCFVNACDFVDETVAAGNEYTIVLSVSDVAAYDVNHVIEYDNDGVIRTVTDVNTTTGVITFDAALDANSASDVLIYNWGVGATDVNEDFHIQSNSPCIDAGDPNGDYRGQSDIDGLSRDVNGVDMGADELCLPSTYSTYQDWLTLGKPDCWCKCYQCDGDADGQTEIEDPNTYRIYDGDLGLITANWLKKIDDPNLDPCADIDHKSQGALKYRVSTND